MKRIFVAFLMLLATINVFAQSLPRMKDPYVTDAADILSKSELKQLRSDVKSMCDYYSTRIVVGIVSTFDDYDIDEYAGELAEKWDLSDENTMLVLVKPKSDEERGEALLLASSDLKDVFTNSVCDEIVREQMIPHFKNDDYFGGIEAALEYMNNMSEEEAAETETETAVATTSSDDKGSTSSKIMEFLSNLGIGVVTIAKWILILLAIAAVIGVIVWLVVRKKEEKEKSSNHRPSHFSSNNNSEEISTALADKKQEIEQRKREIEELRDLDRESDELDDEYENLHNKSERERRRRYDDYDYDYHVDYDNKRSSKDSDDILGKMYNIGVESKGGKILGTLGKVAVGAAGIAGAAAIGKKVKERRENNKDDDDGLLGNIKSVFKKKEKTSNASNGKPKLGGSGKTKASGGKPKLGGGGKKPKLGGNSSSGEW